jgi:hypothetical protein
MFKYRLYIIIIGDKMDVEITRRMGDHTTQPFGMSDSAIGKGLTYGAETTSANGWPDGRLPLYKKMAHTTE